ncbi:MAG: GGDEF domain-containing protein [Ectothiorhodospiraceae bacterium]|jgi:diguanylate cyclase (GGDEF)-like protein
MGDYGRREGDRRRGGARRRRDRAQWYAVWLGSIRYPGWREQLIQFLTRYLFMVLGILFFTWPGAPPPVWLDSGTLVAMLLVHGTCNTVALVHARRWPVSLMRFRLTMWVDIAAVTVCVANDPYAIPPSLLAFIMVALGNGMRYGMPLFTEALVGIFGGTLAALSLNHLGFVDGVSRGLIFINLFGGIILVYAYILMSRIERSRAQLERRSRLDTLTGLMNRQALEEAAHTLLTDVSTRGGRLILMFADMDAFKQVNDDHGHTAGDLVLKQVSAVMRRSVRAHDLVARYGGDEFVLLLHDLDMDEAESVALRIQRHIRKWATASGFSCGVSIGLVEAPAQGKTFYELLEKVDTALYRAKRGDEVGRIERVEDVAVPGQAAEPLSGG